MKLAAYRSPKQALPDLLNWAALIEADVILNKDGSLLAGFAYRGHDLGTASAAERNQTAAVVNAALASLGTGWLVHVDARRVAAARYPAAADSHFPDPVTALLDAERRARFAGAGYYVTDYVLWLTWLPPALVQGKVVDLLIDDGGFSTGIHQEQLVDQFRQLVDVVADRLNAVLELVRLQEDALLTVLHGTLTGLSHPVRVPAVAMYLDAVIGGHDFWSGFNPRLDERYLQVVAIEGFPSDSYPGVLAALDSLPLAYRWNTRFILQDAADAQGRLRAYRRQWSQKVRGFVSQVFKTNSGTIDLDALEMVENAEQAMAEASSGLVRYGYYTAVILLMDTDPEQLERSARDVRRLINNLGFVARVETVNAVEAWLGSLPGHGVQNVRRPMMHTLNLGHLLPLSAVWAGRDQAPCPFYPAPSPPLMVVATEGSTPFRLNLHVGDLGHTLMIGPTGSGKSTALALLAAQFRRYAGATVFAFDKGRSLLPLSLAVGGQHFNITGHDEAENSLKFAPLARIDDPWWLGKAEDWLQGLFELQELTLTAGQRTELHRALLALREGRGEKTLSDLRITVQDQAMKEALEPYTHSGSMGELLDVADDGLALSHWACFEIEELMNRHDRVRLPVLLYLFAVIERSLTGQPALLILDEAWLMLGHAVFRQKLREWLKVLRKANCAVIVATQSLSDAAGSGILDVLTESCPTKLFLANPEAGSELNQPLYRNMGLTDAEIQAIAGMTPKREYFVKGEGKRIVNFEIGPVGLAFVGRSDPESLASVTALHAAHGADFPFLWLQHEGIAYEHLL
ncbi:MAG: conjugal transfer protein TrbE [Thiothrix sp.]|nr:conjugal transfer protein TrbE [Thiothrix sp.]HPQ94807.1 conjugal transfer protein TrbE [Thiolinea sp.]